MSSNNDRLSPPWNKSWNILNYDWFSEYSTIKNVSDCTVWRLPHLFQLEFLYAILIRGDCSAFDAYLMFQHGIRAVNCDLVVCLVSVLYG